MLDLPHLYYTFNAIFIKGNIPLTAYISIGYNEGLGLVCLKLQFLRYNCYRKKPFFKILFEDFFLFEKYGEVLVFSGPFPCHQYKNKSLLQLD
ncbi:MAG: hypothetical protein DRQ89_11955 [Epsilonproteobacteria bacterium]|nr:MAG: hypothetical protein DRQ89_11955 [Campylobacterota bacterium]